MTAAGLDRGLTSGTTGISCSTTSARPQYAGRMNSSGPLRWGIMGTGGIAAAMANTLRAVGSPAVAVGSGTSGRASAFAVEHDIARAVDSHCAVAELDDVDIVYVGTTNDLHHRNVLDAVARGKHVLCEKSIALNAQQAGEMFAAAADVQVLLMEAMWMRFCPFIETLDELMAGGAIGEVADVEAMFGFVAPAGGRWTDRHRGGGALLDLGVYPLSLVHLLLGAPSTFETLARVQDGVDVDTRVISHHPGGSVAYIGATFLADAANDAVISGPTGRLRIHAPFHHSSTITLERGGEVVETFDTGFAGHGFRFEVAEMERCVAAGLTESPMRPSEDTLAVMDWMDAIRESVGVAFPQEVE